MNTSNNTIQGFVMAKLEILKNWLFRYSRIIMPIVLLICVAVTVSIAINANEKKEIEEETVETTETVDLASPLVSVPEVPLKLNAVPEINELIETYFTARVEGDIDTIRKLRDKLDDTEALRELETSKLIESIPVLEVYTKEGPTEGTYIVYVYYAPKFYDYKDPIPGMTSFYAYPDEHGNYCLTKTQDVDENILSYLRELSLQDDYIDLYNKVTAEYNDMVAEDVELQQFVKDLNLEIDKNVGEALARAEGSGLSSGSTEQADEPDEAGGAEEVEEQVVEPSIVVTKVKATAVVNIRTSDSETADKLGKAAIGDEFTLLEERGNGWSKVQYGGREAFIKSDYLEPSETMVANAGGAENETETQTTQGGNDDSATAAGTVTVKENVRIRASASETAEKLGTAYVGEKLELVMKQADGWTKIKYNGRTAYVKSDYVE